VAVTGEASGIHPGRDHRPVRNDRPRGVVSLRKAPGLWWRHDEYVEALQALRDHERVSFGASAPGTGAVEWHRAFRDIEGRLREWTRELRCGREHLPQQTAIPEPEPDDWRSFVVADAHRRV
jgi:hypothetical protein